MSRKLLVMSKITPLLSDILQTIILSQVSDFYVTVPSEHRVMKTLHLEYASQPIDSLTLSSGCIDTEIFTTYLKVSKTLHPELIYIHHTGATSEILHPTTPTSSLDSTERVLIALKATGAVIGVIDFGMIEKSYANGSGVDLNGDLGMGVRKVWRELFKVDALGNCLN